MRAASNANGKDLAKEIALLKAQLEELTESMTGTGQSIVARGEEAVEVVVAERWLDGIIGKLGLISGQNLVCLIVKTL